MLKLLDNKCHHNVYKKSRCKQSNNQTIKQTINQSIKQKNEKGRKKKIHYEKRVLSSNNSNKIPKDKKNTSLF